VRARPIGRRPPGRVPLRRRLHDPRYQRPVGRQFRRLIEQNVAQAGYLAGLIRGAEDLELLAPVSLNVVCLRYRGTGMADQEELNALNRELLIRLQEGGVAVASHTILDGRYAIRVAITNHRSQRTDFDLFVREVRRLGRELTA